MLHQLPSVIFGVFVSYIPKTRLALTSHSKTFSFCSEIILLAIQLAIPDSVVKKKVTRGVGQEHLTGREHRHSLEEGM
jgi:hypothetical protein